MGTSSFCCRKLPCCVPVGIIEQQVKAKQSIAKEEDDAPGDLPGTSFMELELPRNIKYDTVNDPSGCQLMLRLDAARRTIKRVDRAQK